MKPDTFVTRALYLTITEHVVLFAGDPANLDRIKNVLRALPLPNHRLEALAAHLAHLAPCPFCGEVTEDQVKIVLGEVGDIWPNSVRGDVMLAHYEDMERCNIS
jgi:hypothetical protein